MRDRAVRESKSRFFALYLALAAISFPIALPGSGKGFEVSKNFYAVVVNAKPRTVGTEILQFLSFPNIVGDDSRIPTRNELALSAAKDLLSERGINSNFDYQFAIDSQLRYSNGRSASLLLALALIDLSTVGDLSANLKIGATGVLYKDKESWLIGEVNSLNAKIQGAKSVGLDVLYIPKGSVYSKSSVGYRAFLIAGGEIVEVGSLQELINDICSRGSEDKICRAEPVDSMGV